MIQEFETKDEADAISQPKEMEHALEGGKWLWRVRTGKDMGPTHEQMREEFKTHIKSAMDSDEWLLVKATLLVLLDFENARRAAMVPSQTALTRAQLWARVRQKIEAE